jgi:hypothetical protein
MRALQQALCGITGVASVSLCYQPPASGSNNFSGIQYDNRPEGEQWLVNDKPADERYLETFGLTLLAGRNLQPSDTTREFLVNETLVKKLNLASVEEVLNKRVSIGGQKASVVGVINCHFHPFRSIFQLRCSVDTRLSGSGFGTNPEGLGSAIPGTLLRTCIHG